MDMRWIERELLFSALDEDAALSAAENVVAKATDVETDEVLALAGRLAERGFLEFYKYDEHQAPVVIDPEKALTEIRNEPYGVFLQQTNATEPRLAALSEEEGGQVSA